VRIVSLLPSATEILCALGLEDRLVGVTHGCDYPSSVTRLPCITSTGIPADAASGEIDRLVSERHAAGLPLYELDEALLRRLAPDLMITQGLCDVCAVPDHDARAVAARLPGQVEVISLAPTRLGDVLDNILELGARTGSSDVARALVAEMRRRIETIRRRIEGLPRKRVTLLEWVEPLYAAGHWTPEIVMLAGGIDGHGRPGAHSRRMPWAEVQQWRPEVMILACCGLDLDRTCGELNRLRALPGFAELPCAVTGQLYMIDGGAYLSRSGPRLVDSLEILAQLLHPEACPTAPGRAEAGTFASFTA
jgi:iron complex transport system substrate-binding protein